MLAVMVWRSKIVTDRSRFGLWEILSSIASMRSEGIFLTERRRSRI